MRKVAEMTEKELYERVVSVREVLDTMIGYALEMPPTVELCVFTGKLGAALDILEVLEGAGVPIRDPGEEPYPLGPSS